MAKQSDIVLKTLRIMSDAGILDHVLLIGSWCTHYYKYFFSAVDYFPVIKTRDIDFLVSVRPKFTQSVDVEEILKPLGFDTDILGNGHMKLINDELIIEFLVPEIGRPAEKPFKLPNLKFNAQPLRHLGILWRNPIIVEEDGIKVRLPHPVDYLIQKLVIASRRKNIDKAAKDRHSASAVLDAIIEKNELLEFQKAIQYLSKKELKTVTLELRLMGRESLISGK